jgi:hypothetical protein
MRRDDVRGTNSGHSSGAGRSSRASSSVKYVHPGRTLRPPHVQHEVPRDELHVPTRWRLIFIAGAAVFAAANIVVGAFLGDVGHALWLRVAQRFGAHESALSGQLNDLISTAARQGFRPVGNVHEVQFRAGGPRSRVLLLRPIDTTSHVSDELRIYDVTGSAKNPRYKLSLLFQPQPAAQDVQLSSAAGRSAAPRTFAIRLRLIRNLDGQPGNEMIADVSEYAVRPIWPRPVYVFWDTANQSFKVRGLLSPATTVLSPPLQVVTRRYVSAADLYTSLLIDRVYTRPTTIVDAAGNVASFKVYAVESYVLKEESLRDPRGTTAGGLALTAGYIVKSSGFGAANLLQAVTWHLDLRLDPPIAKASVGRPMILKVGTSWSHLAALLVRSRN